MYKLYYNYVELPQKVRLISKPLELDHTIFPNECSYHDANICCDDICMYHNPVGPVGLDQLFKLKNSELFDNIFVYLNEYNAAYYNLSNHDKVDLIGWIDIMQFAYGGHYSSDPLYYNSENKT